MLVYPSWLSFGFGLCSLKSLWVWVCIALMDLVWVNAIKFKDQNQNLLKFQGQKILLTQKNQYNDSKLKGL